MGYSAPTEFIAPTGKPVGYKDFVTRQVNSSVMGFSAPTGKPVGYQSYRQISLSLLQY